MIHYTLPGLTLESSCPFPSFQGFLGTSPTELPRCKLDLCYGPFPAEPGMFQVSHSDLTLRHLPGGWLYVSNRTPGYGLHISEGYERLTAYLPGPEADPEGLMPLLRTALECASIQSGVLSLHSSCVVMDGQGLCFTAPSGTGKSTRAISWQQGLGAKILSGDRPSIKIDARSVTVSGAPWDGKEQLFLNESVPLKAICSIRRGHETYVRKLSPSQARALLCQQCFLPMWDTESVAVAMMLIGKLCTTLPIYRVTCGPDMDAAKQLRDILYYHPEKIMEAEQSMKIKPGFVLRNIAGEHIVMPTGKNISAFDGTIVLNDVAAFVWETLQQECSREELLQAILSEFDVDRPRAETDLDALLNTLRGYQVIEEAV